VVQPGNTNAVLQKIASKEEVENYATEAMVKEYIDKRRVELEDLIKFNMAVDEIFDKEQLPLEDEEVQSEVDIRKRSYQVWYYGCGQRVIILAQLILVASFA